MVSQNSTMAAVTTTMLAESTTTIATTVTTTASPVATLVGSFVMSVSDPIAFVADPRSRVGVELAVAALANVSLEYVDVELTTSRRLGAEGAGARLRRLTGSVTSTYNINIPPGSDASLPQLAAVKAAVQAASPQSLSAFVNEALALLGSNATATVASIVAPTVVDPTRSRTIAQASGAHRPGAGALAAGVLFSALLAGTAALW